MESHLKFPRDESGTEKVSKILAEAGIQLVKPAGGQGKFQRVSRWWFHFLKVLSLLGEMIQVD